MNRWLILATLVFSGGIVAAAPPPTPKKPAVVGDTVDLPAKPSVGPLIILPQPRLGDPDRPDFESGCQLVVPLEAKVLGLLQDPVVGTIIVAAYHTSAKDTGVFQCRDGAILLLSQDGWATLKAAEAAVVQERADQERRREEVRMILRQSGRPAARP